MQKNSENGFGKETNDYSVVTDTKDFAEVPTGNSDGRRNSGQLVGAMPMSRVLSSDTPVHNSEQNGVDLTANSPIAVVQA
jgi:hypothetical protein